MTKLPLGRKIEKIRCECNISIFEMYNTFDVDERGYRDIVRGTVHPTNLQLILFMNLTRRTLNAIK